MNKQKTITKQNILNLIKEEIDGLTKTQKEEPLQRQTAAHLNDFLVRIEKLEGSNKQILSILDRIIKRLMTKGAQLEAKILETCGKEVLQEVERRDGNLVWVEFLDDEEYGQLIKIGKTRKERCKVAQAAVAAAQAAEKTACALSDEERGIVQQLQLAVATRKNEYDEPQRLVALAKAAEMKKKTDPEALADTAEMPAVDPLGDTVKARKLRRENKIITKSFLRQIIKEEIEVVLSDSEAQELFGINVEEEVEKQMTDGADDNI